LPIAQAYIEKQETPEQTKDRIKGLSYDEKNVLGQYL